MRNTRVNQTDNREGFLITYVVGVAMDELSTLRIGGQTDIDTASSANAAKGTRSTSRGCRNIVNA